MPESLTPFLLGALFAAGLALALWSILGRPPHPRPREKSLTAHIVPARAEPRSPWTQLTPKQQEVAALLEQGLTNKEIAAALTISVNTVQSHCSAIYATLGVKNRGQLARLLRERRWVYVPPESDRI